MKNLKLAFFSMLMTLFLVTACTNDEPVGEEQQQTEDSQSITNALNQLSAQFDNNGYVTPNNNPAGNIVLDFCFDFVYPLTFSYNNGTTVSVEDLDGLIDILLASTDELYVNGIAFPFDVEVFNEDTDSIEVVTINNEEEFANLIESCDFEDFETCECTEEYNPVCVEISDPSGETFTVTYPNACYAECDGFTEDDFLESCEGDYNCPGGTECFSLNFPITIITDDGETITVDSQEELDSALYDAYYFDFVYPFTVTLEDGTVETINSPEDIQAILEDCFGDIGGNDCVECEDAGDQPVCIEITSPSGETEIIVFPNMCYALCEGFSQDDVVECGDDTNPDDCIECENEPIDPVCIEYVTASGETVIEIFPNMCFAECVGFSEDDVVECEDDNNPQDCSEEDITNYLTQCEWYGVSSLNPNNNSGLFTFNEDGTVSVTIEGNTITGTWSLSSNPQAGEVFMFISLPEPYGEVSNLDWTVTQCSEYFIGLESNNEFLGFESSCD